VGSYSDNNKKACFFKEKAPQIVGGAYWWLGGLPAADGLFFMFENLSIKFIY
jgi:hypothetical protein